MEFEKRTLFPKFLKSPLVVLVFALIVLNSLDYLTTVYALENVQNAYETNPNLSPDKMFREKVASANLISLLLFGVAILFERIKDRDRIMQIAYLSQVVVLSLLVVSYTLTILNNVHVCLTHSKSPLIPILNYERRLLDQFPNPLTFLKTSP